MPSTGASITGQRGKSHLAGTVHCQWFPPRAALKSQNTHPFTQEYSLSICPVSHVPRAQSTNVNKLRSQLASLGPTAVATTVAVSSSCSPGAALTCGTSALHGRYPRAGSAPQPAAAGTATAHLAPAGGHTASDSGTGARALMV